MPSICADSPPTFWNGTSVPEHVLLKDTDTRPKQYTSGEHLRNTHKHRRTIEPARSLLEQILILGIIRVRRPSRDEPKLGRRSDG